MFFAGEHEILHSLKNMHIFLIERFITALNNHEVQNHVRRRKPTTYAVALAAANEETSFILMDLATHAPGGLQAPTLGDTSFIDLAALDEATVATLYEEFQDIPEDGPDFLEGQ